MHDPTPEPPTKPGSVLPRALLGLLTIGLLTGAGLFLGLVLVGPCPQIEPRALIPVVGLGPAVLGFAVGLLIAVRVVGRRP